MIIEHRQLADELAQALLAQKKRMTCAESCTGGGLSYVLTSVAGCSTWFDMGFVTYSNESKQELLGLKADIIDENGVVSEPVVQDMLKGALKRSKADYGVAISGIAGPDGGMPNKPVGTVCIAWGQVDEALSQTCLFSGDREQVRQSAICQALGNILVFVLSKKNTV